MIGIHDVVELSNFTFWQHLEIASFTHCTTSNKGYHVVKHVGHDHIWRRGFLNVLMMLENSYEYIMHDLRCFQLVDYQHSMKTMFKCTMILNMSSPTSSNMNKVQHCQGHFWIQHNHSYRLCHFHCLFWLKIQSCWTLDNSNISKQD